MLYQTNFNREVGGGSGGGAEVRGYEALRMPSLKAGYRTIVLPCPLIIMT